MTVLAAVADAAAEAQNSLPHPIPQLAAAE